jgi:methionyl-tRNA formyltransferase
VRIVFFGTPSFAVPILKRLAHDSQFDVRLVVSQPDRQAGRGRRLEASPVIVAARELGLPSYQPATLRTREAREPLAAVEADVFVVAAYGLIFGAKTLALPRLGCINVHASLLPQYRGAAPISAAILAGDRETGVTLMKMDTGLDTGPMLAVQSMTIEPRATTESLTAQLAELGADLAARNLPELATGAVPLIAQPAAGASLTRPLTKADGWIDWNRSATELERAVRAFWPWPRAWTTLDSSPLQIHQAAVAPALDDDSPGTVVAASRELVVRCGEGALRLSRVQAAGGKPVSDTEFLAGRRVPVSRLGEHGAPPSPPPLIDPLN